MSDWTSEINFVAHSKELINVYQMDKTDVVVLQLAGIVEGTEVDEITERENREERKREPPRIAKFLLKLI